MRLETGIGIGMGIRIRLRTASLLSLDPDIPPYPLTWQDANTHRMHRHAHRLTRWHRLLLYGVSAVLLVTGSAWLAVHYTVGAGTGEIPHPAEIWAIRLHGMAAFVALFLLGLLAAAHVPRGWHITSRHRRLVQRGTGVGLCVLAGMLVVTGYLLYYFAPETLRPTLGWLHSIIGFAMAAVGTVHGSRLRR